MARWIDEFTQRHGHNNRFAAEFGDQETCGHEHVTVREADVCGWGSRKGYWIVLAGRCDCGR